MSTSVLTNQLNPTDTSHAFATHAIGGVRLLNRVLFVALLALTALVAIPYGTVEPWWIALYELSIFAVASFAIVENLLRPKLAPSISALNGFGFPQAMLRGFWVAPALFLIFIYIQSQTISADQFETRLTFFKLLALLTHAILLYRCTADTQRLKTVVYTLISITTTCAIFGIARHELQQNEVGFILPLLERATGFAQFINKNHFALLIEMSLGLTTGLIIAGGIKKQFIAIFGAAIILMWTALILTSSRGALFSMFGQLAFVITLSIWLRRRNRVVFPSVILGVCLLIAVAVGAVWMGGDLLTTRLEALTGEIRAQTTEPHAGVRRREIWNATWQLFKQHPVAGSGFGAYPVAITRFHDASGKWTPEAAHNDYLELLATCGIVGTALALWFSVTFILRSRNQLKCHDKFRRAACLGALTGIFGVVLHNFVDFGLHVTANSVAFVTLIVVATRNFSKET
jgi:O-antigen ligase